MYHGGMAKPLNLKVDRSAKTTLAEQIRSEITTAIESGVLEPGARLPSWQDLVRTYMDFVALLDDGRKGPVRYGCYMPPQFGCQSTPCMMCRVAG